MEHRALSPVDHSRVEIPCVLCGPGDPYVVTHARSLYSEDRFRVVQCRACGLVYVNPRAATFEVGYEDSESAVDYFVAKESSDLHVRGHYDRVARDIARLRPRASVLDIGAGTGTFLEVLERHDLHGTGVEMSRACVEYGVERRGRRLFQGSIERITTIPPSSFDVATLIQTLEHVGNPVSTLQAVRRYLKPGGLLYVDVPNYHFLLSRFERILRSNLTKHWDPTAHLYYFTMRTLRSVAEAAGYRQVETFTPAPLVIQRVPWRFVGMLADTLFNAVASGRFIRMYATSESDPT